MKVFILTEGGKNIGFGHITRCAALGQCFMEKGIRVEFIIKSSNSLKNILKRTHHIKLDWHRYTKKLFNKIDNNDIVIVDSYLARREFYKRLSKKVKFPVYIDDNKRLNYPRGTVVNGMLYADELPYSKSKDVQYLLGRKYSILRKEFRFIRKRFIRTKAKSIMITFGGDDKRKLTPVILKFFNKKYPSLIKNVIIGSAFSNKKEISNLRGTKTNFINNSDGKDMKKIMLESDFAVTAGGQTLYELARTGTPTTVICVADNQKKNIREWQKVGCFENVGLYNAKNLLPRLERAAAKLLLFEERKKRSQKAMKCIDGFGAMRIVNHLLRKI